HGSNGSVVLAIRISRPGPTAFGVARLTQLSPLTTDHRAVASHVQRPTSNPPLRFLRRIPRPDDDRAAVAAAAVLGQLGRDLRDADIDLERLDVLGHEIVERPAVRHVVHEHLWYARAHTVAARHHDLMADPAAAGHEANARHGAHDIGAARGSFVYDLRPREEGAARALAAPVELVEPVRRARGVRHGDRWQRLRARRQPERRTAHLAGMQHRGEGRRLESDAPYVEHHRAGHEVHDAELPAVAGDGVHASGFLDRDLGARQAGARGVGDVADDRGRRFVAHAVGLLLRLLRASGAGACRHARAHYYEYGDEVPTPHDSRDRHHALP